MRFMLLMIPKGYEKAAPDAAPSAEAVEAMMKYNESLRKADVLLSLDGLHPQSMGARHVLGSREVHGDGWAVHRDEGSDRRVLDDRRDVENRSGRVGIALPRAGRDDRSSAGVRAVGVSCRCSGRGGQVSRAAGAVRAAPEKLRRCAAV